MKEITDAERIAPTTIGKIALNFAVECMDLGNYWDFGIKANVVDWERAHYSDFRWGIETREESETVELNSLIQHLAREWIIMRLQFANERPIVVHQQNFQGTI